MKGILDVLNYSLRTMPTQVQSIAAQKVALDLSSSHKGWMTHVMELRFGAGDSGQCTVKVVRLVVHYIKELVVICCPRETVLSSREDTREKNVGPGVDLPNPACQVLVHLEHSRNGGTIGQVVGTYMKNHHLVVWYGMLYLLKHLWNLKP